MDEIDEETQPNMQWEHGYLAKYGETTYVYDANGMIASYMIVSADQEASDAKDISKYIYSDGYKVLGERITGSIGNENLDLRVKYNYDTTGPIGFTITNTYRGNTYKKAYFYIKDSQGRITGICNSENENVLQYEYDAWGKVENPSAVKLLTEIVEVSSLAYPTNANSLMWKGYYYDKYTGLYFINGRWYDPETRRYISPTDHTAINLLSPNGANRYAFENGNFVDNAYRSSSVEGFNLGHLSIISNRSKWQFDPNFLTDIFGHVENGFSIIEGAFAGYRNVKNLPQLESLKTVSKKLIVAGIVLGLFVDAHNNFSNKDLTFKQQNIGFLVDGLYTVSSAALSYGVASLATAAVALIPGVGVFAVLCGAIVSIAVMEWIDWIVEENGWLQEIKDWIESW